MLIISPTARISPLAHIEDSVRGTRIEIGDEVLIDSFVRINPSGGSGDLIISARCYINAGTVIYTGNGIFMGEGALIAANCTLAPTNHEYRSRAKTLLQQGFLPSKGGIRIGADAWIGANSVVLDGADIGQGAIIGAGSVVSGVIEPYRINVGTPLRKIGERR